MAASAGDAHPFPIYNARFRITFPILDADGDLVTGAAGLDSEASQDQGTFADCTNEATEIATNSGMYFLDIIATELDTKQTALLIKTSTTGAKTTPIVLYPKRLPVIRTGTAQAGGASSITLDSSASAIDGYYVGCYVNITNNSPSNALGQARVITAYVGSTKVATVESTYGTNPSSASTFEILATAEWIQRLADVNAYNGVAATSAGGRPEVNLVQINGGATNGNNATLSLKQLHILNTADHALVAISAGGNGAGILAIGNGTGDGLTAIGGATGNGVKGQGGATSGAGLKAAASAGNSDGIQGFGSGTGNGMLVAGGLDGHGLTAAGGMNTPLSQTHGIFGLGGGGVGIRGLGGPGVSGIIGTGGAGAANAHGISAVAGAGTNGNGFHTIPDGTGVGIKANNLPDALVGGRMDSSVGAMATGVVTAGAIADGAIDNATFTADTGRKPIRANTAAAGAAGTITLDAGASATNGFYADTIILLTGGTGVGQVRRIRAYVGATQVATVVPNWTTNPDNTSTFAILPDVSSWDETLADHLDTGSTGTALNAAGSAGDPWATALPGAYGAGTAGFIIGTNVDALVSSRLAPTVPGRTLDVTANGNAGIDWGNIDNPTTANGLTGTTISTSQVVASVTGAVGSVTGAVGSVTAGVTVTTNSDKTGYTTTAADQQASADVFLLRNLATGSSGTDALNARTVQSALRRLRNHVGIVAGTGTVYKEDDATTAWTAAVTTAAGNPVSDVDPA